MPPTVSRRDALRGALRAAGAIGGGLIATPTPGFIDAAPWTPPRAVRGVTVSCPTWGWEWGTDAMVETLRDLAALGVNWVAIHPYAGIARDGTVAWKGGSTPDWLTRPAAEARRLGLGFFVKPHLAYWGSGFSWRGAIRFDDPADRERFFATYGDWIAWLAAVAPADGFCVATELDGTLMHEAPWRAVIGRVRAATPARLTIASNWDAWTRNPLWDAVDAIGIQGYFPLLEEGESVSAESLAAGWQRVLGPLRDAARRSGRPVVLTELGYPRCTAAPQRPWEHREEASTEAGRIQQLCLASALSALAAEDQVRGAFLWKWFPGRDRPEDFVLQRPELRAVIEQAWRG